MLSCDCRAGGFATEPDSKCLPAELLTAFAMASADIDGLLCGIEDDTIGLSGRRSESGENISLYVLALCFAQWLVQCISPHSKNRCKAACELTDSFVQAGFK